MPTILNLSTSSRSRRGQDPIEGNVAGWHSRYGRQIARLGTYRIECWALDVAVRRPVASVRDGVTYRVFPARPSLSSGREFSRPMLSALRDRARSEPTVVHLHDPHSWQADWIALTLSGVPLVAHAHGATQRPVGKLRDARKLPFAPLLLAEELAETRASARIRHFLVTNGQERDDLRRRGRAASVCPMAPDLDAFRPLDRATVRRDLGLPADRPIVLHVGGFAKPKNLELLVASLAALQRQLPCQLFLAGSVYDRRYERSIRARIARLGLDGTVTVLGMLAATDLNRYYNAADALVVTSDRREGGPVAVLEALATGAPVVSTAVGFVPDMAKRAPGAITIADDRPASIADALARVFSDARRHPDRRLVAHPWTWDDVRRTVDPLYRQLLAAPSRP